MEFQGKTITLKDGRTAILRAPDPDRDAEAMVRYLPEVLGETYFMLRYPEEQRITAEKEHGILERSIAAEDEMLILCEVEGQIVGSSHISFMTSRIKTRHRASVGIALRQAYWNQGIGTAMMRELIDVARQREGVEQIELQYIEGNTRARALYEKLGFRIAGIIPDAVKLKDGTLLNEYHMILKL